MKIHPPKTMFLRIDAGEAECGKLKYEMSNSAAGQPIIRSHKTGKWFSLTWQDIIEMAIEKGIDK